MIANFRTFRLYLTGQNAELSAGTRIGRSCLIAERLDFRANGL